MKRIIILFLTFSLSSIILNGQDTTHVLFIGNSITYFNNMPQTFEAIANSHSDSTKVTVYAPGGTGFINHVTDINVYNHFKQGNWDYIILQPGSNESPGYSYPIDQTLHRARILIDSAYKYNPCAEILYYEISYGVWSNSLADLQTYNNTMDLILANLEYLADSTKTFFAPVGEAFKASWNNDLNDLLWAGYGDIHPNPKGSYIAACVFYSTIFRKPSLGTTEYGTLNNLEATNCQILADSIVLNNTGSWRIETYRQHTDFTYSVNSGVFYFNNLSMNTDSVYWNFGDGNNSTNFNPDHYYLVPGNYTVILNGYKNGCLQSTDKNIVVSNTNNSLSKNSLVIYPNPASTSLQIEPDDPYAITVYEIYDCTGKLMLKTNQTYIDISNLSNGIYNLRAYNRNVSKHINLKWIKY